MYSYWPCVLFDVFLITNTTGIKNKENESKHYLKMLIKMDLNMKTKNRTQLFKRKNFPKHVYVVATNYTIIVHTVLPC